MDLHPDFKDLLSALADTNAEYLVVGGWAVGYHAEPRFTKDLDLFIGPSKENLDAVARALARFGAPGDIVDTIRGLGPDEFLFLGASPVRIDILRRVDGVVFGDAYARRVTVQWDGVPVSIIAFDDLVASKKAAGRERDRRDLELLEAARRSKQGA
ncbi:MAG: nucleotidyl transferase AbiEii/AbiGii toxin family protein [Polyangiaceae bacterium]